MTIEKLQSLINLESKILDDLYFDINYCCDYKVYSKFTSKNECIMYFHKIFSKISTYCYEITKETDLRICLEHDFKTEKGESLGGKTREYCTGTINGRIYHLIPSKYNPKIKYEKFNSSFEINYDLADRDDKNSEWDLKCWRSDHSENLNNGFDTYIQSSECNNVVYAKYEDLEFVFYDDEFNEYKRFHQCEGDVYNLQISEHQLKNYKIDEIMDFVTTDGACRIVLKKN